MTTQFEQVLMNRDNMSREEAMAERNSAREEILNMIEDGFGYDDVEDLLLSDYGLEMDYIFDLI